MMRKEHNFLAFILVGFSVVSLCSCGASSSSGTLRYRPIVFHIGERTVEFTEEDNIYQIDNLDQEHRRFAGWSTDETKDHIICEDKDVSKEKIKDFIYYSSSDRLDLYAIYADILDVDRKSVV